MDQHNKPPHTDALRRAQPHSGGTKTSWGNKYKMTQVEGPSIKYLVSTFQTCQKLWKTKDWESVPE